MGNKCRPKYFGSRRLIFAPGRKDELNFFWQKTYYDYLAVCAKKGTFAITDQAQLAWINLKENTAVLDPHIDRILTSRAVIEINYKSNIRSLPLSVKWFFDVPKHASAGYRYAEFDYHY